MLPLDVPTVPLPRGRPSSLIIDPSSPLSAPPASLAWRRQADRFRPRWDETENERLVRMNERRVRMLQPKAHTERLFNSPQRLDAVTGTVLPKDLLIGLRKVSHDGGRTVTLVPARILHRDWAERPPGKTAWMICCREALADPRKIRGLYRLVKEPRFSDRVADQIGSQLIRRLAQELVVWELDPVTEHRPVPLTDDSLASDLPPGTGAVICLSASSFSRRSRGGQDLVTLLPDDVPCWNLEGLLAALAKDPPTPDRSLIPTAATSKAEHENATRLCLADALSRQIRASLLRHSGSSLDNPAAFAIPLAEETYPTILALRRCTWWLCQGWHPRFFPSLGDLLSRAEEVKADKAQKWELWLRSRAQVKGTVNEKGMIIAEAKRGGTFRPGWPAVDLEPPSGGGTLR